MQPQYYPPQKPSFNPNCLAAIVTLGIIGFLTCGGVVLLVILSPTSTPTPEPPHKPWVRYSLYDTLDEPHRAFWDVVACQDKVQRDSLAKFPNSIDRQAEYENKGDFRCIDIVRRRYRYSESKMYKILGQGTRHNWEKPDLTN